MEPISFTAIAWNNEDWHDTGTGYGLRVVAEDRDRFFEREWHTVALRLVGTRTRRIAEANVAKASFWGPKCQELIKQEIGQWLIENGYRRWTHGASPRFRMVPVADREFEVRPDQS